MWLRIGIYYNTGLLKSSPAVLIVSAISHDALQMRKSLRYFVTYTAKVQRFCTPESCFFYI